MRLKDNQQTKVAVAGTFKLVQAKRSTTKSRQAKKKLIKLFNKASKHLDQLIKDIDQKYPLS